MLKLITLVFFQTFCLVTSQVTLKIFMQQTGAFQWTKEYFIKVLTNIPLAVSGISITAAMLLWLHVLKRYEFSLILPLVSMSYVFGTIAGIVVFKEVVPLGRWIGLLVIIIGVLIIARTSN